MSAADEQELHWARSLLDLSTPNEGCWGGPCAVTPVAAREGLVRRAARPTPACVHAAVGAAESGRAVRRVCRRTVWMTLLVFRVAFLLPDTLESKMLAGIQE